MSDMPHRPDDGFEESIGRAFEGQPPAPPPEPPRRKTPLTLIIGIAMLAVVAGVAIASTFDESKTPPEAELVSSSPSVEVSCIDTDAAAAYSQDVVADLTAAQAALGDYDVVGAASYVRQAADDARLILTTIHNVPEVYDPMSWAAEAYDSAADELEATRFQSSLDFMDDARRYTEQSTAAIEGNVDCAVA